MDELRWDQELAEALVGAVVIVGLTFLDAAGEVVELQQLWGVVDAADAKDGIRLRLRGRREGETHVLPPHTSAFEPADPGSYTLRSTGETIEDPDYLSTWTIQRNLS
jgi:hypothetical protein